VTGVSIGAINAAVLVGGRKGPVPSLAELWEHVSMRTLPFLPDQWQAKSSKAGNPGMYTLNPMFFASPLTAESLYDLSPFENFLQDLIDFDQLNQSPVRVIIESVNVESGQLQKFSNHDPSGLNLAKVVSSMSVPPNFPAKQVEMNFYWDGGLFANMPLSPAINWLEKETREEDTRELIIISLFRKSAQMPQTLDEISNRIKEIIFESKLELDEKFFQDYNHFIALVQAIDQTLPSDSPIRKMQGFQKLMAHKSIQHYAKLQYRAEGVEGTDDFTPDAVRFRVRKGYRDMEGYLEKSV
jgi:NTE family protein